MFFKVQWMVHRSLANSLVINRFPYTASIFLKPGVDWSIYSLQINEWHRQRFVLKVYLYSELVTYVKHFSERNSNLPWTEAIGTSLINMFHKPEVNAHHNCQQAASFQKRAFVPRMSNLCDPLWDSLKTLEGEGVTFQRILLKMWLLLSLLCVLDPWYAHSIWQESEALFSLFVFLACQNTCAFSLGRAVLNKFCTYLCGRDIVTQCPAPLLCLLVV